MASNNQSGTGVLKRTEPNAITSHHAIRLNRKRPFLTSALPEGGAPDQANDDKNNELVCPICFEILDEPYMTKCGHSFCYECITKSMEQSNHCPKCNTMIDSRESVFPNFVLNNLTQKLRQTIRERKKFKANCLIPASKLLSSQKEGDSLNECLDLADQQPDHMTLKDVNKMLDWLNKKKAQLETVSDSTQTRLLGEFLGSVKSHKQEQLEELNRELRMVESDLETVNKSLAEVCVDGNGDSAVAKPSASQVDSVLVVRRKKMDSHFDDLEECYFAVRELSVINGDVSSLSAGGESSQAPENKDGLNLFSERLSKFTRFSRIHPISTLTYASDMFSGSSIVSSIEFDRDGEYFAIAGVTKKIKVFDYANVIRDVVDIHYPATEMLCNSKISCVSWSGYHKSMLASSDYEGTVTVWDAFASKKTRVFQEHEKRCWSVDFNRVDTKIIASGSDDARVKLWSTNVEHSVASLEAKANVCCVQFHPRSRYHIAFGCADHCVYYYDLRNQKVPQMVFKGHSKAVSYVKFLNGEELVSASTDSQLKLWNVGQPTCVRSFKGHINEKNFVGLATDGDYIACGSENNSLFVYYKGLSKQLLTFKFDTVQSVLDKDKKEDDLNEFVSAVCWKADQHKVIAANSQGTIKILELE